MNKITAFIIGLAAGGGVGSAVTYYVVKNKFESDMDQEIEEMEEFYEQRYQKKLDRINELNRKKSKDHPEPQGLETKEEREDEKVTNNKGVKKYHHDNGLESAYGSARIFGNDAKPKKEEKKKVVNEISEQEFLNNENGYEKQTIDVFMSNDDETPEIVAIWAYETDNEEFVEKRFKKSTEELLDGRTYEQLCEYCDDDEGGVGVLYLKNEDLHTDFECILHKNLGDV